MTYNLKLIYGENQCCAYNIDTFGIFSINQLTYKVLSNLIVYDDLSVVAKQFGLMESEIVDLLQRMGIRKLEPSKCVDNSTQHKSCDTIRRITLHVSNDCNLRCRYCYASGGSYNKVRGNMDCDTARRFVDFCCDNFSNVENVVFFGGEPFLNVPVIEYICSEFTKRFKENRISFMPKFGAITNGTILSKRIYSLIEEYFSFLTVSLDGPQPINDKNRVHINGNGSFAEIDKFLSQIKGIPGLQIGIESTYTKNHIESGISRLEIQEFINNRYGLSAEVIDEISLESSSDYCNMTSWRESPWFLSILETIVSKQSQTKCPIVKSMFAVSTEGHIYPCHLNVGDNSKPVSSVWNDPGHLKYVLDSTDAFNLKDNNVCNNCWANKLCGGCSRTWFFNPKTTKYVSVPNHSKCEAFRKIAEDCILKIAEIRRTPELWSELLQQFNINHNEQ